jgi:Sulfotransferase family
MTAENINYRVAKWQPPKRPEWVERVNEEGRCLDLKSVVPLDKDSLIGHAKANTGLTDFGSDDWYEPFKVFIEALDEEADLTLMGRLMTRSDILMHLEARLQIEDWYKRHPEIDDVELAQPYLIVGSGRSGTSAIQNLLSYDPDNATPRHWEALFPAPPPEKATYHTDPRIELADKRMDQWNRVTPELESIHEFRGNMPTELIQVETPAFQNNGWLDLYGFVPSYHQYMAPRGLSNSFKYARRILKLLQWKNPRRRWILKSPDALRDMPGLIEAFPELRLIWMHRDPIKSVASAVNMVGTLYWVRSDQPLSDQAIAQLTSAQGLATHFDHILDQIDAGVVPADRFAHVQYLDFVADPIATVAALYSELGIDLTHEARSAMEGYLKSHPREARPKHRYETGDQDILTSERRLFERYETRFGVARES